MTRKTDLTMRPILFTLLAALLLTSASLSAGTEPDEREERRVRVIKKHIDCEGDDCADQEHRAVFIGGNGDVQVFGGENGEFNFEWLDERLANLLHHHGGTSGGYLGIGLTELTNELRSHFGVPSDAGVMVSKVMDESPAQRGGLLVGDIIVRVNGDEIANSRALSRTIRSFEDGAVVDLEVWREGTSLTVTTTLEEREAKAHGWSSDHFSNHVVVRCEDDEDCEVEMGGGSFDDFDCGGAERCEVRVECDGPNSCECAINGESVDCSTIPGVPHSE